MIENIKAWIRSNFFTKIEITVHTAATAAHGATGAVVGTTNTQTLTNKTLTAPTITDPVITGSTGAWTGLTFNTGWGNFGGIYQTGQYKKVGDLVFLRGLVVRSSGVLTIIATLPVNNRPPAFHHFPTTSNNLFGEIDIDTAGNVDVPVGAPASWVSLNGIFFSVV